ncbi:hypothetical protein [Prosthecobacter sp.]|uniref:hypothetical protein n=1 Tax=Prosthecobacter sp. TaxID=1965333 RepID=UPI003784534D
MKFLPAFVFLLTATPLCACLWDRDTIAMEAQGRLEVVETMVGWFDRFPPEYYQMRLDRVTKEIGTTPERLELYDDAAVACDRLGRHDDAVAWMDRKSARMAALPPEQTTDHRYRMHANLGVFRTHQWIKTLERNAQEEKLKLAIEEVKTALEINPNAHFGRERAHLALLEWWQAGLHSPGMQEPLYDSYQLLRSVQADFPNTVDTTSSNLVKGYCGLIQMGSAQDSLDVHFLVSWLLMNDRTPQGHRDSHFALCYLTCLRMTELIKEGREPVYAGKDLHDWLQPEAHFKGSKVPPTREEMLERLPLSLSRVGIWGGSGDQSAIPLWFHQARAAARQRLAAKTAFMQQRFAKGMHPDTHTDFWNGWEEPQMPEVPRTKLEQRVGVPLAAWLSDYSHVGLVVFALAAGGVVAIYVILLVRRKRARPLISADARAECA